MICEPLDASLLPPAIRALPSVDLTRNRLVDYLALKEMLSQAGSKIATVAKTEAVDRADGIGLARLAASAA